MKKIIGMAVIIAVLCVTMLISGNKWIAIPLLLCGILQAINTAVEIKNARR